MRSIEMKSWTVTRVIMWHLCQHGVEASEDWVSVAHSIIYSTPRCRAQWQAYHEAPTSHVLNRQVGIHGLSGFEFAVVGQLCTQNVTHTCLFTNVRTHAQHIQSPRPVENLTGVGQCSKTGRTRHAFQFYKNSSSKYLNFKFNAMQFLDIWKCIKRYQNATLSITPRKSKTFCCCNRHYFSSHDQHVWSWTHDHTPANPTISHPGMI